MALTASYTAPWTIAMPRACPCAVGRMRTASAWAVAFHSPMTSARATAGAARTPMRTALAQSARRVVRIMGTPLSWLCLQDPPPPGAGVQVDLTSHFLSRTRRSPVLLAA